MLPRMLERATRIAFDRRARSLAWVAVVSIIVLGCCDCGTGYVVENHFVEPVLARVSRTVEKTPDPDDRQITVMLVPTRTRKVVGYEGFVGDRVVSVEILRPDCSPLDDPDPSVRGALLVVRGNGRIERRQEYFSDADDITAEQTDLCLPQS
jgi:hypothetical protein